MFDALRHLRWTVVLAAVALSGTAVAADPGARCAACHLKQVQSFRSGGMARAMGPFVPGELEGVEPLRARSGAFEYRFEPSKSGARIIESILHVEDGVEAAREIDSARVLFTIGAGIRDRSFAVQRGELMRFAPLEVARRADGGGLHAQLSPGQSIDPNARWNVPIAEECLRCHTSNPPPRDFPYDLAPPASWTPSGIDCASCHARADAHAAWQESRMANPKPGSPDPIHGDATPRRSGFDSCARCHLQGDALLSIAAPLRGIPDPDADLFAQRAVFVAAEPTDEIGFVSHVERLSLSSCFVATRDRSTGALSCTTCHDPHQSLTNDIERARVRNACSKCHASEHSDSGSACSAPRIDREGRDCVSCHMRLTGVFDVADIRIHDHRIERVPPPASKTTALRIKSAQDGRLARFLPSGERSTDRKIDPGLWMMAFLDLGRRDSAWSMATREPGDVAESLASFHHLRAGLREEHADFAGAEADLRRALEIDPGQAESGVNLGALLIGRDRDREAVEVLTRVLERHPRSDGALRNRGVAYLKSGQVQAGAQDLEAAYRVQATAPVARLLAQVCERSGDAERARQWADRARALDPTTR